MWQSCVIIPSSFCLRLLLSLILIILLLCIWAESCQRLNHPVLGVYVYRVSISSLIMFFDFSTKSLTTSLKSHLQFTGSSPTHHISLEVRAQPRSITNNCAPGKAVWHWHQANCVVLEGWSQGSGTTVSSLVFGAPRIRNHDDIVDEIYWNCRDPWCIYIYTACIISQRSLWNLNLKFREDDIYRDHLPHFQMSNGHWG